MASFQAKTVRARLRKREKKLSFRSIPSRPGTQNSQKIAKKLKKNHYGFFSSQHGVGLADKEKKKKLSFQSVPTRPGIENSKKNSKKIQKIKKHYYGFISSQNRLGDAEKERKKNYRSHLFLPDPE